MDFDEIQWQFNGSSMEMVCKEGDWRWAWPRELRVEEMLWYNPKFSIDEILVGDLVENKYKQMRS